MRRCSSDTPQQQGADQLVWLLEVSRLVTVDHQTKLTDVENLSYQELWKQHNYQNVLVRFGYFSSPKAYAWIEENGGALAAR